MRSSQLKFSIGVALLVADGALTNQRKPIITIIEKNVSLNYITDRFDIDLTETENEMLSGKRRAASHGLFFYTFSATTVQGFYCWRPETIKAAIHGRNRKKRN